MFDEDYENGFEEGGIVGFSFDELAMEDAKETSTLLLELDDKLFDGISEDPKHFDDDIENSKKADRNYYSMGYDANYNAVDEKEFYNWKTNFNYIRAEGKNIDNPDLEEILKDGDKDLNTHVDNFFFDDVSSVDINANMIVVGKGIEPVLLSQDQMIQIEDQEGTYLARHGVIEDILEMSCEASISTKTTSPRTVQIHEIIRSVEDAVWPNVVEALRPFIQRVLKVVEHSRDQFE